MITQWEPVYVFALACGHEIEATVPTTLAWPQIIKCQECGYSGKASASIVRFRPQPQIPPTASSGTT